MFRLRIWDKGTGAVIYDNQMGDEEDADPTTELGAWWRVNRNPRRLVKGSRNLNKKSIAIIAGVLDLLCCAYLLGEFLYLGLGIVMFLPMPVLSILGALIAFVGGIYSVRRKQWPIAIAGSISAIFICLTVVMIYYLSRHYYLVRTADFLRSGTAVVAAATAVVLTVLSRKEFKK